MMKNSHHVMHSQDLLSYFPCAKSQKPMMKLWEVGQEFKSKVKVVFCDPTTFSSSKNSI